MNNSVLKKYPFYTVYSHLSDMFGMEISEDQFEVMALSGWEKINNKEYQLYRIQLIPEPAEDGMGWYVTIPCNCDIIESVTAGFEDYQRTSPIEFYNGYNSSPSEHFNEYIKYDKNALYQSGKLLQYRVLGDRIYINEEQPFVNILYKGIYVDEEGLPFLNIKEVEALTSYCAFCTLKKKSYQSMDANTLKLSQLEEQNWKRLCSAARVPQHINQNEINQVLDAKSNWNRKLYNKSFKPV